MPVLDPVKRVARAVLPARAKDLARWLQTEWVRASLSSAGWEKLPEGERFHVLAQLVADTIASSRDPVAKNHFSSAVFNTFINDQQTALHTSSVVAAHLRRIDPHTTLRDARVLELGPGHNLGSGLLCYALGAQRWVGVDPQPIATRHPHVYRALRSILLASAVDGRASARLDEVLSIEGDRIRIDAEKVELRQPVDAMALPFAADSFDIVLSNSVLEHIEDPALATNECHRVLAPGGYAFHGIDLRDHRDFSQPLAFLGEEQADWKSRNARAGHSHTNRWRRSQYEGAFVEAGFEIVAQEVTERAPVSPLVRAGLHRDFESCTDDDLEVLGTYYVLQRPIRKKRASKKRPAKAKNK